MRTNCNLLPMLGRCYSLMYRFYKHTKSGANIHEEVMTIFVEAQGFRILSGMLDGSLPIRALSR